MEVAMDVIDSTPAPTPKKGAPPIVVIGALVVGVLIGVAAGKIVRTINGWELNAEYAKVEDVAKIAKDVDDLKKKVASAAAKPVKKPAPQPEFRWPF